MSGWIKFEKDLLTDPRVLRIARILSDRWQLMEELGGSEIMSACNSQALPAVTLVCGALVRIWVLADTHIDPDNVLPLGKNELNDIVGIPGFCDLLPEDWMVEIDEHQVELPHFHAHNGTEAKKKAVTQKRVARHRVRALQSGNGRALPDLDLDQDLDKTKKETTTAPDASRRSPPKRIEFDSSNGAFKGISEEDELRWQKAYPAVIVPTEITRAAAWVSANPANKKSNYERFIVNWLSRAQDRAPRVSR